MAKKKKQPKKQNKQNKSDSHFCWACGQHKSNENFSGKGHANHICKKCKAMPVAERNEMIAIRKIENMAHRYLNEQEIKWLRKKMKDPRTEVREIACEVHRIKFPRQERNNIKKGLTAFSLELFINSEVWNEWGDEMAAHMLITMEHDGTICRTEYNALENERETKINVDEKEARAFLKSIIHEHDALFWNEDFSDSDGEDFDFDEDDDFEDEDGESGESGESESETATKAKEPIFSLTLELNNGENKKIVFYNNLPDAPQDLFWSMMGWFEPEDEIDFEDNFENEHDGEA